jgi:hypothetical protein
MVLKVLVYYNIDLGKFSVLYRFKWVFIENDDL